MRTLLLMIGLAAALTTGGAAFTTTVATVAEKDWDDCAPIGSECVNDWECGNVYECGLLCQPSGTGLVRRCR